MLLHRFQIIEAKVRAFHLLPFFLNLILTSFTKSGCVCFTCSGEGVSDKLANELILRRPQQQDNVSWKGFSVLGQEARGTVNHLKVW